jgi:hypothetical protein
MTSTLATTTTTRLPAADVAGPPSGQQKDTLETNWGGLGRPLLSFSFFLTQSHVARATSSSTSPGAINHLNTTLGDTLSTGNTSTLCKFDLQGFFFHSHALWQQTDNYQTLTHP